MKQIRSYVMCSLALARWLALGVTNAAFASAPSADGHDHGTTVGLPGLAGDADRTVTIIMSDDFRFTPSQFTVTQNETVRLLVENKGQLKHEITLGTEAELQEHLEEMREHPGMDHDEPHSISLLPGEKREMVWKFTVPGEVNFGCLIPGHYEAGMKGLVEVDARS